MGELVGAGRGDAPGQGPGGPGPGLRGGRPRASGRARQAGPRDLARLRRRLRPARRAGREPQGGPRAVRAGGGRRGAGDRARRLRGGRGPLLGPAGDPALHACPRGAGPYPLDAGPARGGGRALPRHAPAQPRRQPGRPLHPGRLAPEPGPGRRAGRAPGAVRRRLGRLGLHQGPARLPPRGRHARGPEAAPGGQEVEQARPGLPAGRGAAAAGDARLLRPRRPERGDDLCGLSPGRLEVHAGGRHLAARGPRRHGEEEGRRPGRPPARPRSPRSGSGGSRSGSTSGRPTAARSPISSRARASSSSPG